MLKKIKELATRILCKVWKKPLPALLNKGVAYVGHLSDEYFKEFRYEVTDAMDKDTEKLKVEYCVNVIMLVSFDYLCKEVLDNPRVVWPARYTIIVNVRDGIDLYIEPREGASREEYNYLPYDKRVYNLKFGGLEVVCSRQESNRMALTSNSELEVFILDKWWAIAYKYLRWYYIPKAFIKANFGITCFILTLLFISVLYALIPIS